jgi:hypothetical protein
VIHAVYATKEPVGDFIYMKDSNKAVMKLYKKTSDDLEDDEEDEEL